MAHSARMDKECAAKFSKQLNQSNLCPVEHLRAACMARGCTGIHGIGRAFRIADDDGNRTLSFDEFREGIRQFGVMFDNKEARELFDDIDVDHSGQLDYEEFLIALRPPMSNNRKSLVYKAFDKLDRVKDGVITVEDLKGVYSVKKHPDYLNGTKTEEQLLLKFLETFDLNRDGQVTQEEFMNYYSGVSASIDTDAYFDLMMRQAWKL